MSQQEGIIHNNVLYLKKEQTVELLDSEQKVHPKFLVLLQYMDAPADFVWRRKLRRLFFYSISGLYVTECFSTMSLNRRSAQLLQMRCKSEHVIAFKLFF